MHFVFIGPTDLCTFLLVVKCFVHKSAFTFDIVYFLGIANYRHCTVLYCFHIDVSKYNTMLFILMMCIHEWDK